MYGVACLLPFYVSAGLLLTGMIKDEGKGRLRHMLALLTGPLLMLGWVRIYTATEAWWSLDPTVPLGCFLALELGLCLWAARYSDGQPWITAGALLGAVWMSLVTFLFALFEVSERLP